MASWRRYSALPVESPDPHPDPAVRRGRKLAGSLSLAVSLPTMLVGFRAIAAIRFFSAPRGALAVQRCKAIRSIVGTFIGGLLLGVVPHSLFCRIGCDPGHLSRGDMAARGQLAQA